MKLLVLGGTVFVGRWIVEAALVRGHDVTLFNRGRKSPDLFESLEKLRGDRDGDLSALRGRAFDAVIDTSGYNPAQVTASAAAVHDAVGLYLFVSSISVYRSFPPQRTYDEQAPVASGNEGYGPLKARSEEALEAALPGRVVHVRPGLIVGPHDPTERFTYWPRRVARGGRVLAPGRPDRPIQFIDARDLAEWCVHLVERRCVGTFNAVGPDGALTMRDLLHGCRDAAASDADFVWVPDDALAAAGAKSWSEVPLWIPESDADFGGLLLATNARAVAAGLRFRPVADTIRATVDWDRGRAGPTVDPLTAEREAEILATIRSGAT